MVYEHKSAPLLPSKLFFLRVLKHFALAFSLLLFSLAIGVAGYHYLENILWIDALLNASMILGGMGPVDTLTTDPGKIFASFYSLYSGIIFLAGSGILIAPIAHRILHQMHLEEMDLSDKE